MHPIFVCISCIAVTVFAARPFLSEPDTGINLVMSAIANHTLLGLSNIIGLHDFQAVARNYLPTKNYTYFSTGVSGEWSARNNLEAFYRYTWKPRHMRDITNLNNTINTSILGFNFSAPFYISPCARAVDSHIDGEINFVKGAASDNILYIASGASSYTFDEIQGAKADGQVVFQQVYLNGNITKDAEYIHKLEQAGADALVLTIDSVAGSNRHRAERFGVGTANTKPVRLTWPYYDQLQNVTNLPIVVKGITSVPTAVEAANHNVPAIVISNHGGRTIDGSPSPLEVMIQIHKEAPEILNNLEVWADGGVRYGGDILKLMALGAKAVGVGRPYMFANIYGVDGVKRATEILKNELVVDAGNLGLEHLHDINENYVNWIRNSWLG